MRRPDARWTHAARVALAATLVVALVAALLAVALNVLIVRNLTRDIDSRLAAVLAVASAGTGAVIPPSGQRQGDLDDVPDFVWRISAAGGVTALSPGAPPLPAHHWHTGVTTLPADGTSFRYAATPSAGGWLVAGASAARAREVPGQLLVVELTLGALLLAVTFTGSFIVGLRASAPIEQIRRREAAFTADASHELRTPLSVIQAEVDLSLSRERDPVEYREALSRIDAESHRLLAIVDDLLWLARADGEALRADHSIPVDLAATVAAAAARFAPVADARSITLTTHSLPPSVRICGDEDGIERLVTVLVDNACKYAGPGGAVDVGVAASNGSATLTVDDSGPGIRPERRSQIFDRFHRDDQLPGGTGLGLAIADAVVRATEGTWTVADSSLGGARFGVTWRQATAAA